MPKWKLEPSETTSIEIYFNSSGMLGNVHKSITVTSDDPVNPKVELTFGASVVREIMPSKSVAIFDELSRYTSASTTIRLESGMESPVEITAVKNSAPYITCEIQREGNDVLLNLSINGQLIPKQSNKGRDTLFVHTTSVEVPSLQFFVEWDMMPEITASHKRIAWSGEVGSELRTNVSLSHSGGKSFKILDVTSTSPYVKVPSFAKNSTSKHEFDVTMVAEAKAGMYYEKLTIKLDDPEQSELEISIAAVLR